MAASSDGRSGASFSSIVRVSPTDQVREQLLSAIQQREYGPGDALPSERALCELFGVSRVSVREAIAGLEAMGLVTVQHGRGCFVAEDLSDRVAAPFGAWLELQRDQVVALLKVRGSLDELAAAEAARAQDLEAIATIEQAHARFSESAKDYGAEGNGQIIDLIHLDVAFHNSIAAASGISLLTRLIGELAVHMADSRRYTLSEPGRPAQSQHEHEQILSAIRAGDADTARTAAASHVADVIRQVEEL